MSPRTPFSFAIFAEELEQSKCLNFFIAGLPSLARLSRDGLPIERIMGLLNFLDTNDLGKATSAIVATQKDTDLASYVRNVLWIGYDLPQVYEPRVRLRTIPN